MSVTGPLTKAATSVHVNLGGILRRGFYFTTKSILGMRIPYIGKDEAFTEEKLVALEPIAQFDAWFELAKNTEGIQEANAMCLATATKDGRPSARMVLLKAYGSDGFKFFTNYESRKGKEITENPYGALNFYWEPLKRCVRVEGKIEKLSGEEATEYFDSRPISSRIGAAVSAQSQPVPNRDYLMKKEKELQELVQEMGSIQKPMSWGGFILVPETVEFWQGQTNRIHDRIRFRKPTDGENIEDSKTVHQGVGGWIYERLSP